MRKPHAAGTVIAITVLLATAGQEAIHWLRGDPTGQIQSLTDEPSHFVTGLMIRDYLIHAFASNPIEFAKSYYLHYPKVAFGSWPPLLHICLGVWMLPFPATRHSALLYEDVLAVVFALVAALIARRSLPLVAAVAVGVASWISPITQSLDRSVQADIQYSLLSVLCTYAFATYLDKPDHRRACWFGLALFGAMMTKNNALFLGISLPLTVLLARSLAILRRWDAWLAAIPAILAFGVWQYFTLPFVWNNMTAVSVPGLAFFVYIRKLAALVWVGLLPFVIWSVYRRVFLPLVRRGRVNVLDSALFGLLVGPCLFHSLLSHDVNQRYLLPSLPALLIFAIQGLLELLSLPATPRLLQRARVAIAGIVIVLPAVASPVRPPLRFQYDYLASRLIAAYPKETAPAFLISASGPSFDGEGLFVGEMATHERRPGHWVLRASKFLLHKVGTLNKETELVAVPSSEMLRRFQSMPVSLVIIVDNGYSEMTAERSYLEGMIRDHPNEFHLALTSPVGPGCHDANCTIRVYELKGAPGARFSPDKLPPDMPLWKGL